MALLAIAGSEKMGFFGKPMLTAPRGIGQIAEHFRNVQHSTCAVAPKNGVFDLLIKFAPVQSRKNLVHGPQGLGPQPFPGTLHELLHGGHLCGSLGGLVCPALSLPFLDKFRSDNHISSPFPYSIELGTA